MTRINYVQVDTNSFNTFPPPPSSTHEKGTPTSSKTTSSWANLRAPFTARWSDTWHEKKTTRRHHPLLRNLASWYMEIISLSSAGCGLIVVGVVLLYYDGKPSAAWPHFLTLNAVIALIATLITANLAAVFQSGLSQAKWIHFKTKRSALSDMEAYDAASRGIIGSVKYLLWHRDSWIASYGACIAICALALSPLAQQIVAYSTRNINSTYGASTLRSWNMTGYLYGKDLSHWVPEAPMKGAVYQALFENSLVSQVMLTSSCTSGYNCGGPAYYCPTGNCTFPTLHTIAVCDRCEDVTPSISRSCTSSGSATSNDKDCIYRLPSGATLNGSANVFSMQPLFPNSTPDLSAATIMALDLLGTESPQAVGQLNLWARRCALEVCVQTIDTIVAGGNINETEDVASRVFNATVFNPNASSSDEVGTYYASYITPSPPVNSTYFIDGRAMLALRLWFAQVFAAGNSSIALLNTTMQASVSSNPVFANYTTGNSTGLRLFDSDVVQTFYWCYYYGNGFSIDNLVKRVAQAMTVNFRSRGGSRESVLGEAWVSETYVHVRWGFFLCPLLVVGAAGVFLGFVVVKSCGTGTELWKTSALAAVFYGPDERTKAKFSQAGTLGEKKRRARDVKVVLRDDGRGDLVLVDETPGDYSSVQSAARPRSSLD